MLRLRALLLPADMLRCLEAYESGRIEEGERSTIYQCWPRSKHLPRQLDNGPGVDA